MKLQLLHLKVFKIFLILAVVFTVSCNSYFIKRSFPDKNYATVHKGEILYSGTEFRIINDRTRMVYKFWRFEKADKKYVTLLYEENIDSIKLQPDLKEEKKIEISKDYTIVLQDMVLDIYELGNSSISYYIKSAAQ